jgi:hypothetical protein
MPSRLRWPICSLACILEHRDVGHPRDTQCPRRAWRPPKFGERFAGERAPLSLAVAMEGHIEVQAPFDLHFGQDMFTEEGRKELDRLMADEALYCEHWAPECHLFSRARGRPIQLADGRTVQDPQPVRDQKHLMAFLGFLLRQRLGSGAPTTWCSRPSEGENSFARPLAPATGQWNTPTAPACGSSLW